MFPGVQFPGPTKNNHKQGQLHDQCHDEFQL